jgi:hypothetical protein
MIRLSRHPGYHLDSKSKTADPMIRNRGGEFGCALALQFGQPFDALLSRRDNYRAAFPAARIARG